MSNTVNVYLTDIQKKKLAKAFRDGKKCTIKIDPMLGNDNLRVTEEIAEKIRKARAEGASVRVTLSSKQLQLHGGFLPFLIPLAAELVPLLAGTAITEGVRALVSGSGTTNSRDQLGRISGSATGRTSGSGYLLPFMRR